MQMYGDLSARCKDDNALFEDPILASIIKQGKQLLERWDLPLYYRAKTNMFLSSVIEDWGVAEEHRTEADYVWRTMRGQYNERGAKDKDMETKLAEIREGLNRLKVLQCETKPASWLDEYDSYAEDEEEEEEVEADEEELDEKELDQEEEVDDANLQRAELPRAVALSANHMVNNDADDIHSNKQMLLDAGETTPKVGTLPSEPH